jgi:hypothetical protein
LPACLCCGCAERASGAPPVDRSTADPPSEPNLRVPHRRWNNRTQKNYATAQQTKKRNCPCCGSNTRPLHITHVAHWMGIQLNLLRVKRSTTELQGPADAPRLLNDYEKVFRFSSPCTGFFHFLSTPHQQHAVPSSLTFYRFHEPLSERGQKPHLGF